MRERRLRLRPTLTPYLPAAALACALAVLASEVGAGHVHCGDVITADTTLDSDLVGCPGFGLLVGASGITLDLDGHTVGGAAGSDTGIMIHGVTGVTVRNGRVTRFNTGIALVSANRNTLGFPERNVINPTELEIFGNRVYGVFASRASRNTIGNADVHDNGRRGIHLDNDSRQNMLVANRVTGNGFEGGIAIVRSDNNFLLANFVAENGLGANPGSPGTAGITLDQAPASQLFENVVRDNRQDGVHVLESDRTFVVGTIAAGNGGSGVHVERSERVQLVVNDLQLNGLHGVFLDAAHHARLFENTASGNGTAGFFLEHGQHNVFLRNEAHDNLVGFALSGNVDEGGGRTDRIRFTTAHNGLHDNVAEDNERWGYLLGDVADNRLVGNVATGSLFGMAVIGRSHGNRVSGTVASSNTVGIAVDGASETWVVGNFIGKNTEDGIRIGATARRTRVEDNESSLNGDDGIDVESPETTIRRNVADDNNDLGIEAVAGVTDGGGNSAAGNGDPAQCVNVAC